MPNWCCGGGFWMMLFGLLILVALVIGLVLLVRVVWNRTAPETRRDDGTGNDAVRVLEERYARGGIDRDEFDERRRTLRSRT